MTEDRYWRVGRRGLRRQAISHRGRNPRELRHRACRGLSPSQARYPDVSSLRFDSTAEVVQLPVPVHMGGRASAWQVPVALRSRQSRTLAFETSLLDLCPCRRGEEHGEAGRGAPITQPALSTSSTPGNRMPRSSSARELSRRTSTGIESEIS